LRSRLNRHRIAAVAATIVLAGVLAGCETQSFFDPSEMGRYPKTPLIVPILDNLDTGYSEVADERFARATTVRPADLVAEDTDYSISPNDVLQISLTDLVVPGQETYKTQRVSQSGNISLPYVGQVKASGLTEAQLEEAIAQAYRDKNIVQNMQVSVTTVEARGRTFSILGAVTQPGQYAILQSDFRVLDALVIARDVNNPQGVENLYIIRRLNQEPGSEVVQPRRPTTRPAPDVLTPGARSHGRAGAPHADASQDHAAKVAWLKTEEQPPPTAPPATQPGEGRIIIIEGKPVTVGEQPGAAPAQPTEPGAVAPMPPQDQGATQPFEFNEPQEPSDVRVIHVPLDALKRGELRYNAVIRPNDLLVVADPVIGEYYMGGHVQRTGVYSLSARKITLKQAVISAGMLDQLAMPYRTMIVRRIGNREIFARVDLAKIFNGEEPDVYLKPYDEVMVGTNALAPFLAAVRNGFRITYGFGFLYDRNYAPVNNR
jgi:polysaccharide export outer membrane protein